MNNYIPQQMTERGKAQNEIFSFTAIQYFAWFCSAKLPNELGMSKFLGWGASLLKRRPVLTNTVVYATFYTAAEMSQQTFNKYFTPEKADYDVASAARIVSVGSAAYAPTLYFWYKLLDRKFAGTAIKAVAAKVAADQLIMSPVLLATFYTMISVLEQKDDVFGELREKYWKTFAANQAFWIPGQTINFLFIPPHLRVVYVASASFIWINVLCFIIRQKVEASVGR